MKPSQADLLPLPSEEQVYKIQRIPNYFLLRTTTSLNIEATFISCFLTFYGNFQHVSTLRQLSGARQLLASRLQAFVAQPPPHCLRHAQPHPHWSCRASKVTFDQFFTLFCHLNLLHRILADLLGFSGALGIQLIVSSLQEEVGI